MLKSKVHRARVADVNIDCEGSITIDKLKILSSPPIEQWEIRHFKEGRDAYND